MSHHTKSPQEFTAMVHGVVTIANQDIHYRGLARGIMVEGWYDVGEVSYADIHGDDGLDPKMVDKVIRQEAEAQLNRSNG